MKRTLSLLLMCAFSIVAQTQSNPTFQGGISLVHVDAAVLGNDGRVLTGFSKGDFRVFDNGQEQQLAAFLAEEQPLDLVLLFDISGSMRRQIEKVAAAAQGALHELRPGDRVSVMVFNTEARPVSPFTGDLKMVEDAIHQVLSRKFRGGTDIREGVYAAANRFIWFDDRQDQCRRAVLIITDNLGRPSRSETSVVENLWEADALLDGLVVRSIAANLSIAGLLSPLGVKRVGGIDRIVEKTGGDMIYSDDLGPAFPEMMHRIRRRYSLYYKLPEGEPGGLRTIRVELSVDAQSRFPGAHVAARHGYKLGHRDERTGFYSR